MSVVESGLAELLQTWLVRAPGSSNAGARPKAAPQGGKKASTAAAQMTKGRGTVAAARAAGIPEESLKEMARLIGANKRNRVEEKPILEALDKDDGGGIPVDPLEEEPEELEEIVEQDGNSLLLRT